MNIAECTKMKNLRLWLRLRRLAKGKVKYKSSGICGNLADLLDRPICFVILGSNDWPFKSNNTVYPVPYELGNPDQYAAILAFDHARKIDNMWDFSTEYGKLRQDLCFHLIKRLEESSTLCKLASKLC